MGVFGLPRTDSVLASAYAALASDQSGVASDTMTDITGCAITLSPGTWMIWAQSNQGPGGSYSYAVVQTGGSGSGTAISQGEDNGADGAGRITIAIVPTFITPTVTTSYHLRGQMGGGGTFYANPNSFGPGNFIAALRIGG